MGTPHGRLLCGKAAAQYDSRTLKLGDYLDLSLPVPDTYDFDLKNQDVPTPMFANDQYGCCVIAARAHQTERFEKTEQKKILPISDNDVVREYLRQTGGEDTGLVMLDAMKKWRSRGWTAAGRLYTISAFGALPHNDPSKQLTLKQAVFYLTGMQAGVSLPLSAQDQFDLGQPWDVVDGEQGTPGSWGGHAIFISGYTPVGPVCVTWGRKQQLTWAFWYKYADEAYGIVDSKDKWLGANSPLNLTSLMQILQKVTA